MGLALSSCCPEKAYRVKPVKRFHAQGRTNNQAARFVCLKSREESSPSLIDNAPT